MSLLLTLNIFTPCSSVSIVNFEHVTADWEGKRYEAPKSPLRMCKWNHPTHKTILVGHIWHLTTKVSHLKGGLDGKILAPWIKELKVEHLILNLRFFKLRFFFLAFGLNTERYGVSLRIQSESGKKISVITIKCACYAQIWQIQLLQWI